MNPPAHCAEAGRTFKRLIRDGMGSKAGLCQHVPGDALRRERSSVTLVRYAQA